MKIPIEVSARHIHLSEKDFEKLFGRTQLQKIKNLSQPKQFASKQEVNLIHGKNKLKARVLGPFRKNTQTEISITDAYELKLKKLPPINLSGQLNNASTITIQGPKGKIKSKSIIIPKRHLHIETKIAKKLKLKNNQKIKIKTISKRPLIFEDIIVRTGEKHKLALHIDTDEANAAGILKKSFGKIVK